MSEKVKKRRENLWIRNNGECYYCGTHTVLPNALISKSPPPNMATLDHIRSRLGTNKDRNEPNNNNEERTVLACWQCNLIRGILDHKSTEKELTISVLSTQIVDSN